MLKNLALPAGTSLPFLRSLPGRRLRRSWANRSISRQPSLKAVRSLLRSAKAT